MCRYLGHPHRLTWLFIITAEIVNTNMKRPGNFIKPQGQDQGYYTMGLVLVSCDIDKETQRKPKFVNEYFQRNDRVLLACSMALVPVSDVQVLKLL